MAKHPAPVYLPIEFLSRELDSKALLAVRLATLGYTVVIGQQWQIYHNLPRLPAGSVLFKSFNSIHHPAMQTARQYGHRVAILEEELLGHIEPKAIRNYCTNNVFELPDVILANGDFEKQVLQGLGATLPIEVTGNGRVDLLKPAYRAFHADAIDQVRREHDAFVLINTNFGIIHSVWESIEHVTEVHIRAGFIRPDDPASVQSWQDQIDFERRNFAALREAITRLAGKHPQTKFIVRPHPGEDLRRWNGVFTNHPNVLIIREGPHLPWTLASSLLLHTSCTTGFEARVAGKTAFSLVPQPSWISDSLISNRVNPVFRDPTDLVQSVDKILAGGPAPDYREADFAADHYVWNFSANSGVDRIATILSDGLVPGPVAFPPLEAIQLNEKVRNKFSLAGPEFARVLQRVVRTIRPETGFNIGELADSLFVLSPKSPASTVLATARGNDTDAIARISRQMEDALEAGDHLAVVQIFRENYAETHRRPDLQFVAGRAAFEQQDFSLALQYFQNASLAPVVNHDVSYWMSRTWLELGDGEAALGYAREAHSQAPNNPAYFELLSGLEQVLGRPHRQHWLIIGDSHVRYFRYMQTNRCRYFGDAVHLECYEFGGATAYGLGNLDSRSGVLRTVQQLHERMSIADRIIVHFGEVDCRRAAWKASATTGEPVEVLISKAVQRLAAFVRREILPHNRNVVLLGAKPQIISDDDFYVNARDDERIVFQPLTERQRITTMFNGLARGAADSLKTRYLDIDRVLEYESSRRDFLRRAFWDTFTTDTHGNLDHFAHLYYNCLKDLIASRTSIENTKSPENSSQSNLYPRVNGVFENLDQLIDEHIIDKRYGRFFDKETRFFTQGSCFAENLANALKEKNYKVYYNKILETINSPLANARYLELLANSQDSEPYQALKGAEVFILTIGVAPCWFLKSDGSFVPSIDPRKRKDYFQRTLTVQETRDALLRAISLIRQINPTIRIVISLSPVPLTRSFEFHSTIVGDAISKSVLRAAIHEALALSTEPKLLYLPSFEIVRWAGCHRAGKGDAYGDDGLTRHVSRHFVEAIINAFVRNYGPQPNDLDDDVRND